MISYIDRQTKKQKEERIYGRRAIELLYGDTLPGKWLLFFLKHPLFSWLYGLCQTLPSSRKRVVPFVKHFDIDASEFALPLEQFSSFNDFFTRRLKPECRPIAPGAEVAVAPADGRYRFYPNIAQTEGFLVKGKKFSLEKLLQDRALAERYAEGTMVMARLCPVDYHRFHFPAAGLPSEAKRINGPLYSVNPMALRKNIEIFSENRRYLTKLHTEAFGTILYLEVGAAAVGRVVQTYTPGSPQQKGAEKGYFSFGGSSLLLLFLPGRLTLDADLLGHDCELFCRMGESIGTARNTTVFS